MIDHSSVSVSWYLCILVIGVCGGSKLVIGSQFTCLTCCFSPLGHDYTQPNTWGRKQHGETWAVAGLKYLLHVNECLYFAEHRSVCSVCVIERTSLFNIPTFTCGLLCFPHISACPFYIPALLYRIYVFIIMCLLGLCSSLLHVSFTFKGMYREVYVVGMTTG